MLLERAVVALAAEGPQGWARIDVIAQFTVIVEKIGLGVVAADGSPLPMRIPGVLANDLRRSRHSMYQPGRGTWLSLKLSVFPDGTHDADFNFDDYPGWSPPPRPYVFARDLESYPRDDEHVHPWWAEQLALAEAEHSQEAAR